MAYKLQLKRGVLASLPNGSVGEPLFTTDTFDLYVGKGDGTNVKIQKFIASGSSSQFLKGDGSLDSNTYIGLTALSASAPLSYNNTTGAFTISQASGSTNGYLSSGDWTTFNAKQAALSGSGIVKSTGGTISYLTDNSANWDTAYNDKINSASVSGTTTKTLTLTQQDGGTITTSWSDYDTAPVTSVFGRTGDVVAANGDYTTSQVTEGTNLYYTDARARAAITLTTTGSSGASTYVGGTLNIPTYTLVGLGGVASSRQLTINGTSYDLSADRSWSVGTVTSVDMSVPTGFAISGNPITSSGTLALAFASGYSLPTNASQTNWDAAYNDKINSASVSGTTTKTLTLTQQDGGTITASWSDYDTAPVTSVFGRTGVVTAQSGDYTTTQVTEGTNLYYTDTRVSANTDVAANTAARHSAVTLGTANGLSLSTQQLSLGLSSGSTTGALSSTDWTTFNSKQAALSGTGFVKISGTTISYDNSTYYLASNPSSYIAKTDLSAITPLSYDNVTGVFQMTQANSTTSGYITSTDWNTFNNKQSALTNPVTGTGTTNYLPKFTGSTTIGNSRVTDDGSLVTVNGTGVTYLRVKESTKTGFDLLQDSGGTGYLWNRDNAAILFGTNDTERMRLTSTGLGIGTTTFATDSKLAVQTSGGKFDVRGIGVASIVLESNGGMHYNAPTGNFHKFQINNSTLMELNGSGNLGLGVTPSAWGSSIKAIDIVTGGAGIYGANSLAGFTANAFIDATSGTDTYKVTDFATKYLQIVGTHRWYTAPSGTAGAAISFTQAMTLDASGRLGIGNTSPTYKLDISVTTNDGIRSTSSAGQQSYLGNTGGEAVVGTLNNYGFGIITNGSTRLTIASTGAATFSSSVTATQGIFSQGMTNGTTSAFTSPHLALKATSSTDDTGFVGMTFATSDANNYGYSYGALRENGGLGNLVWRNHFNSAQGTELMRLTYNGRLGIGTTSPSGSLDIYGTTGAKVRIGYFTDQGADDPTLRMFDGKLTRPSYSFTSDNTSGMFGGSGFVAFSTSAAERMRITSGGLVGIGTSSPIAKLHIENGNIFMNNSSSPYAAGIYNSNSIYLADNQYLDFSTGTFKATSTGTSNRLQITYSDGFIFYTSPSATGGSNVTSNERMRITTGGNVGIGTTSPNDLLHINGSGIIKMRITGSVESQLRLDGPYGQITSVNGDLYYTIESASGSQIFRTGSSTERMRITSGGNVGIGTTNPDHPLNTSRPLATVWYPDIRVGGYLGQMNAFIGSSNGPRVILSGGAEQVNNDGAGSWAYAYNTGASFLSVGDSGVKFFSDGSLTTNATYTPTERMRITSGGVVCINTTSASPGQNNSDTGNTFNAGRFFFNNSGSDNIIGRNTNGILISWRRAGVEVGTVDVTTTSTTYNTSSDYRLKTDFKDFSGIDLVGKIKAYDYEWKSDKTRSYGVIAHELQSVIGYAVTGEKDGERMQGVDYSKIVPVLIKAIQELKAEIDILKNK